MRVKINKVFGPVPYDYEALKQFKPTLFKRLIKFLKQSAQDIRYANERRN